MQGSNTDVPIGTIITWPTAAWQSDIKTVGGHPDDYLECNGQVVDIVKYPDLAKIMSVVPNYQGLFLRSLGGNSEQIGDVQGDAIRNINGTLPVNDNQYFPSATGAFSYLYTSKYGPVDANNSYGGVYSFDASRVVPTAIENRPINTAVIYLVKAK